MRRSDTQLLFKRILPAVVLCLLATLFAAEAKFVKYIHSDCASGEVYAGKLFPANPPRVFQGSPAGFCIDSTYSPYESALAPLISTFSISLFVAVVVLKPVLHAATIHSLFFPYLYLRPPPEV